MSVNSDFDQVVTVEPRPNGTEPPAEREAPAATHGLDVTPPVLETLSAPNAPDVTPPVLEAPAVVSPGGRKRPRWVVPAAIAAVGVIAAGTLGYLFYTTSGKLDATRHQLAATQLSLDTTNQQLSSAQADAASKKTTADYMSLYVADSGKVRIDYQEVAACQSYSACRTSAQQALADMQAFQADRRSATVPAALTSSDSQLGDSLSAGIAALQQLISGMDNDNLGNIKAGFSKLDASMLGMAKAEAALGAEIR